MATKLAKRHMESNKEVEKKANEYLQTLSLNQPLLPSEVEEIKRFDAQLKKDNPDEDGFGLG